MINVYETYINEICKNCKNNNEQYCEIRKDINGTLKCNFYERKKKQEGYKDFKLPTANKHKQVMKGINR